MSPHFDVSLHSKLVAYCDDYCAYHNITDISLKENYFNYISTYNKDARQFLESGKYPAFTGKPINILGRQQYSIILLLSTFLTSHRFRIMRHIINKSHSAHNALFVGCGPGLEIYLLKNIVQNIVAYDLELDTFLRYKHKDVDFRNEYFNGSGTEKYESIYLIEILEHLEKPYELLANCAKVMTDNAELHLTTATNIPQFDHLYYFDSDHKEFDRTIKAMGFEIIFSEDIVHEAMTVPIDSKNKYYILKKKS